MLEKSPLLDAIDSVLQDEAQITTALVPWVSQLATNPQPIAVQTLVRLRIEAVRRVWATADTHAFALVVMLNEDYDAARIWISYLEVAMQRDKRLLEDLPTDEARVRATAPLRTTVAMIETMARNISMLGSLPAVAYALFIEWNHDHATDLAVVLEPGERTSPLRPGPRDDYANKLVELAQRLISRHPAGLPLLVSLLRQSSAFIRATLTEVQGFTSPVAPAPQPKESPAKDA